MSNFSNGQQQRTASPNLAGQKEALSVAGCAQVFSWQSKEKTAGAKVTVNSKNNGLHEIEATDSAELLAQFDHNGNRAGSTAGEILTNHNVLAAFTCAKIFRNLKVQTAFPVGRMTTFVNVLAVFGATDRRWRRPPTRRNNSLKNEVGRGGGKAGNSATGKSAGFCGCLLVVIESGADQPKQKGQFSPALRFSALFDYLAFPGLLCLSQSSNAASIRVCQPLPVALNALITSGEQRIVMRVFVALATGRPRFFSSSNGTSTTSSPSSNIVSGSDRAAAVMAASSSGVGSFVPGLNLSFDMASNLPTVGLSEADNAPFVVGAVSKHNAINPIMEVSESDVAFFPVISAGIVQRDAGIPLKVGSIRERNAVLLLVYCVFGCVKSDVHRFIVCTINKMSKGDLLPGAAKEKGQHTALTLWLCVGVDHSPGVSGFLRPCRLRSVLSALSDKYSGGLPSDSAGGCVPGFCSFAIRQPSVSDLALRRCSSSRATLTISLISSPAFVPISSTRASASREDSRGFSSLPSTWRRAISPRKADMTNEGIDSPSRLTASIASTTSCGTRVDIICDFVFFMPVAIFLPFQNMVLAYYIKSVVKKSLTCRQQNIIFDYTFCSGCSHETAKPGSARTLTGPLTTNDSLRIEAAMKNSTTHPQGRDSHDLNKFTWRFLALNRSDLKSALCRLSVEAATERDARRILAPYFILSLAARLPLQGVMKTITPSTIEEISIPPASVLAFEMAQEVHHA